jgi:alkaline phosphatase D
MESKARLLAFFALGAALGLLAACGGDGGPSLVFTHGVASGDVTPASVVLWTRVDQEGDVRAQVATDEGFSKLVVEGKQRASADHDFVVKLGVDGLEPATRYYYRFLPPSGEPSPVGTFQTAPPEETSADVTFAYDGDSDASYKPFNLLTKVREDNPAFFIFLGDTIYADYTNTGLPAATTLDDYRQRYKVNWEDEPLRALLASTSTYAIWDDHEVKNDFAGQDVDQAQMAAGRQAFLEYLPIREDATDPNRLYRTFKWGKDVELFILDERQYRSAEAICMNEEGGTITIPSFEGDEACKAGLADPSRTFLGQEQKEWLKQALLASTAKFKFIVNEVAISELTLLPYDRWEGYSAERRELLDFLKENDIKNVIFLTTDLHASIVKTVDGRYKEVIVGPIGTTPLGAELESIGVPLSLAEGLVPDVEYKKLDTFSYGLVKVTTSTTPARVQILIKDLEGQVLSTVDIPEEQ